MSELQAGIYYAGAPHKMYCEKRGTSPCVTLELDITSQAANGAWTPAPKRDDDKPHRVWLRMFTTDKAWPYTEKKLRKLQFNGDFYNPAVGVESVVVIAEQNGKYLEWDLPREGGGDEHEAVDQKTLNVLTARYANNNPAPQPQAASASNPPAPQAQQAPPPAAATTPPPKTEDGEDIPF